MELQRRGIYIWRREREWENERERERETETERKESEREREGGQHLIKATHVIRWRYAGIMQALKDRKNHIWPMETSIILSLPSFNNPPNFPTFITSPKNHVTTSLACMTSRDCCFSYHGGELFDLRSRRTWGEWHAPPPPSLPPDEPRLWVPLNFIMAHWGEYVCATHVKHIIPACWLCLQCSLDTYRVILLELLWVIFLIFRVVYSVCCFYIIVLH